MGYVIQEHLIHKNDHTRPGTKIDVKGVVIHWTANEAKGADADAHFRFFDKGETYASAHYFVDKDTILRIIPENEMAYHVGAKSYKTQKYGSYPNAHMIGVEMCVNSDGNFTETYKRAVWLVADLLKRHKLGLDDLERHYDITGKDCPKMFITDSYGQKYMGLSASAAYAKFCKDVGVALKGTPSKPVVDKIQGKPTHKTYRVQNGDTLWGVATKNHLTVDKLKSLNGLKSNTINPGDVLKLS